MSFPGASVFEDSNFSAGDAGMCIYPSLVKIPWRTKQQPTPAFLPGESPGQRSLVGYSSWGHKESDISDWAHTCTHTHTRGSVGLIPWIPGTYWLCYLIVYPEEQRKPGLSPDSESGLPEKRHLCLQNSCENWSEWSPHTAHLRTDWSHFWVHF